MHSFSTLGIWLDLPKQLKVGEQFKMELDDLAPILVAGELHIKSAPAHFELASFDAETGIAKISGQATIREQGDRDGRDNDVTYTGECLVQVKPAEKRLLSLSFSGKFEMKMQEGAAHVAGGGDFTIELVTELGEAVEKARKQKTQHRPRVFVAPSSQLMLELPSHYAEMSPDEGVRPYMRTLDSTDGNAVIRVEVVEGETRDSKAFLAAVEGKLRKEHSTLKTQEVSSPLGKGRAFLLETKNEEGEKVLVRSEFYPHGKNQYAVYKLMGRPKAFAAALTEFNKARRTLQKAKRFTSAPAKDRRAP